MAGSSIKVFKKLKASKVCNSFTWNFSYREINNDTFHYSQNDFLREWLLRCELFLQHLLKLEGQFGNGSCDLCSVKNAIFHCSDCLGDLANCRDCFMDHHKFCHFTESRCEMASIFIKWHCMSKVTYCILAIMEACAPQQWRPGKMNKITQLFPKARLLFNLPWVENVIIFWSIGCWI